MSGTSNCMHTKPFDLLNQYKQDKQIKFIRSLGPTLLFIIVFEEQIEPKFIVNKKQTNYDIFATLKSAIFGSQSVYVS